MRAALVVVFLFLLLIFLLTTFPQSAEARREAEQYFTPEQIETGLRFAFERKLIFWANTFLTLGFYTWLVFSGNARRLADWFQRRTGGHWLVTLLFVAAFCFLAERLLTLPLRLVSVGHLHHWEMMNMGVGEWLADYGKALALEAGIGGVLLAGLYLLMRWLPRWWWVMAASLGTLAAVAFTYALPVCIEPIFYDFKPLKDPQLEKEITQMAEQANVPVCEVLVIDASRKENFVNAYFTGFGDSRRIVLYDTLVEKGKFSKDEILSVVAHEIGHWRHNHIMLGIALGAVAGFVAFFLLSLILRWSVDRPPFHLRAPWDPAGWPLVVLLTLLSAWLTMPVENAVSRYFERQADAASLELAGKPDAFITAEKRLATENKSNVAPSPLSVWLFATHPTAVERIRMAEEWAAGQRKQPDAGRGR